MLALICACTADDRQAPDPKKWSRHFLSEGLVGVQARTRARPHARVRARRLAHARAHRLRQMPKAGSAKDLLISLRGVFTSFLMQNDATTVPVGTSMHIRTHVRLCQAADAVGHAKLLRPSTVLSC
jgi:hypothetical protein